MGELPEGREALDLDGNGRTGEERGRWIRLIVQPCGGVDLFTQWAHTKLL